MKASGSRRSRRVAIGVSAFAVTIVKSRSESVCRWRRCQTACAACSLCVSCLLKLRPWPRHATPRHASPIQLSWLASARGFASCNYSAACCYCGEQRGRVREGERVWKKSETKQQNCAALCRALNLGSLHSHAPRSIDRIWVELGPAKVKLPRRA